MKTLNKGVYVIFLHNLKIQGDISKESYSQRLFFLHNLIVNHKSVNLNDENVFISKN